MISLIFYRQVSGLTPVGHLHLDLGQFRSIQANTILTTYWNRIQKEMAKYEKNLPFFDVPDFFGTNKSRDLRGRFDI